MSSGWSHVPVTVAGICGRLTRPVGAWRRLAVGQRLVLNQRADDPIPVTVNGQVMGAAKIVIMDGHYALELVTWGRELASTAPP